MKKSVHLVILLGSLVILVACTFTSSPPQVLSPAPTNTLELPSLPALEEQAVLLQLEFEPTYSRPESFHEYGRLPVFTLYSDGTLINDDETDTPFKNKAVVVQLSADETTALWKQVMDMELAKLESYTEHCRPVDEETRVCVYDASYTILRFWTAEGPREVKIYADFSADPEALEMIRRFLLEYRHPAAEPYAPVGATLFLEQLPEARGVELLPWPLPAEWLEEAPLNMNPVAYVLKGEELTTFLAAVPSNLGDVFFEHEGNDYRAYLIPWLPDQDYTSAIGN
jgi:hypothetical protein